VNKNPYTRANIPRRGGRHLRRRLRQLRIRSTTRRFSAAAPTFPSSIRSRQISRSARIAPPSCRFRREREATHSAHNSSCRFISPPPPTPPPPIADSAPCAIPLLLALARDWHHPPHSFRPILPGAPCPPPPRSAAPAKPSPPSHVSDRRASMRFFFRSRIIRNTKPAGPQRVALE